MVHLYSLAVVRDAANNLQEHQQTDSLPPPYRVQRSLQNEQTAPCTAQRGGQIVRNRYVLSLSL